MKQHLLLIDDNKNELNTFIDALILVPHDDGFKCTYAHSVKQACEMLKLLIPDFIFVNHNMPAMNGLEFIAFLTSHPPLRNTKLCLYATNIVEQTRKLAKDLGATYIKKRGTKNELAESLSELLASYPEPGYRFGPMRVAERQYIL
jgi:CheY-like chemotaxis protein